MSDELIFGNGYEMGEFYDSLHPEDKSYFGPDGKFHLYAADLNAGLGAFGSNGALLSGGIGAGDSEFKEDIAQSRFFTLSISQIVDRNSKPIVFSTGEGTWMSFLPVKNINFSFTNYDNMSVPFAALGDIPVLQRKKVSTISISCYDTDDDIIEQALIAWENRCFPKGNYVAYLENVKAEFLYKSYDVKGKLNYERKLEVIPASAVAVNRGYDENSEKLLTFSVASIGELSSPVNNNGYRRDVHAQLASDLYEKGVHAQLVEDRVHAGFPEGFNAYN